MAVVIHTAGCTLSVKIVVLETAGANTLVGPVVKIVVVVWPVDGQIAVS
jgi:hypothetical protein